MRGVGEIEAARPGLLRWKVMWERNWKARKTVVA